MADATPIRVPIDNVNDETVRLLSWAVENGQNVRDGQLLAELETSKAVVEMMAPHSGKVWFKVLAGQEVAVGAIFAYITTNGTAPPSTDSELADSASSVANPAVAPKQRLTSAFGSGSFSKKALELIELRGLSPEIFAGKAMVREQDVKDHLAAQKPADSDAASPHFAL